MKSTAKEIRPHQSKPAADRQTGARKQLLAASLAAALTLSMLHPLFSSDTSSWGSGSESLLITQSVKAFAAADDNLGGE